MRWLLALLCLSAPAFACAELTVTVIKRPITTVSQPASVAPAVPAKPNLTPSSAGQAVIPAPARVTAPGTAASAPNAKAVVAFAPTTTLPLPASPARALTDIAIDKVLVIKSAHRLELMSHGEPVKAYKISLGKQPRGPKLAEGDRRTPEGFYWLDWRKTSDRFNLAMHVSYPNIDDAARARREGTSPGGMIMIHGTPISDDYPEWYFASLDWTDGCIAMNNADMREVWSLVKDGTMIEIRP
jgi:lipoprotein-anchoring transpeptidase ErfK/SrfK